MSKIISFSLWGNKAMYTKGAIFNIHLAKEIYSGWICRFYVNNTVEEIVVKEIEQSGGEIVRIGDDKGAHWGAFWRFLANDDPEMDIFISRDCDSRLNYRERGAVEEWEKSDKSFHIMHDHPYHMTVPILGGMWGAKKGCINNITDKINKWGDYNNKGIDETFLKNIIWPEIQDKYISHGGIGASRYGEYKPFPSHQSFKYGGSFVGEVFDKNNNPVVC